MRIQKTFFAAALAATLCGLAAPPTVRADVSVSVSVFHQQLAPHGRWVSASYGDVWVPGGVAAGWAPYVDGEWIYTDYGWTWVSNDPWGDTPYHYGTWAWVDPYGWVWVPGTVWAPAWVTWAYTDDYIGWAPVPPSFALSVGGYAGRPIVVAETRYVFVPSRQFVGTRVSQVRVAPAQNAAIFRRASKATSFQVSNGIVRTGGLPSERVARATGHKIERVSISRARTQPTTFAQGGAGKSKSISVVAPERVKAPAKAEAAGAPREAPKAHASNRDAAKPKAEVERHEAQTATKSQPQSHEARPEPKAKSQSQSHEARPAPKAQSHEARPEPKEPPQSQQARPAPKAPPQTSEKSAAPKEPHGSAPKAHAPAPKAKPDTPKPEKKPDTQS
jgi:hypothetical protein